LDKTFKKYGFELISMELAEEISARLHTARHIKSGARLYFIEREDSNMTFAIAFPTPPEDSTGVFHIIEHSVLCGSERFPVKEPFVDLLKGSLNTFLNAVTYPEKTVYPVSSRCKKDFLGLAEVYLDAVFHPLMLSDKRIFMQEGWHYSYDKESDTLGIGGVVYSEMQGAYSSPDDLGQTELLGALFPDNCYRHDSGGNPKNIPELTYERFVSAHKKYYSPSSAHIVLDGSVDLDGILPLLDRYLSEGEGGSAAPPFPVRTERDYGLRTVYFPAPEGDGDKPRGRLLFGYCFGDCSEVLKADAVTVISSALLFNSDSPLKSCLLSSGLCCEVEGYCDRGYFNTFILELRGVKAGDVTALTELVEGSLKEIISEGIPRDTVDACLNRVEFRLREQDFGGTPPGVNNALKLLGCTVNGRPPREAFSTAESLRALRRLNSEGGLDGIARETLIDCKHRAALLMLPDPELEKREAAELSERLAEVRREMTEEDISEIIFDEEQLLKRQTEEDSPEARATLPRLSLSDITPGGEALSISETAEDGVPILSVDLPVKGILYAKLYFNCSDLSNEELSMLPFVASLLTDMPTESHSVRELKDLIRRELGSLICTPSVTSLGEGAATYAVLHASALTDKGEVLVDILREVLTKTDFRRKKDLEKALIQMDSGLEDSMVASADTAVIDRAEAGVTGQGHTREHFLGYEAYLRGKGYLGEFRRDPESFADRVAELAARVFTAERLTLFLGGDPTGAVELGRRIVKIPPRGGVRPEGRFDSPLTGEGEGLIIPSSVSHTALAARSPEVAEMLGTMRVVRSVLSYGYLWNEVRVQGGAYGTGFYARRSGVIGFYSYRDPSPRESLECFMRAPGYLRSLAESGEELTDYIIGAFGEYDALLSPKQRIAAAISDRLSGWSPEKELALRREMLSVDAAALLRAADVIEDALRDSRIAVAASEKVLDGLSDLCPLRLKL